MHNGQIGDFATLRRPLELALDDELYNARTGSTDSEILFLLALQFGLKEDPQAAFARTIRFVENEARSRGLTPFVRFTSAFSCGRRLFAIRYSSDEHAPTLFWAKLETCRSICLVSEPFEDAARDWQPVPPSSFVTVEDGKLTVTPFCVERAAKAA